MNVRMRRFCELAAVGLLISTGLSTKFHDPLSWIPEFILELCS